MSKVGFNTVERSLAEGSTFAVVAVFTSVVAVLQRYPSGGGSPFWDRMI